MSKLLINGTDKPLPPSEIGCISGVVAFYAVECKSRERRLHVNYKAVI